jgi:chromosome segregation ATPase
MAKNNVRIMFRHGYSKQQNEMPIWHSKGVMVMWVKAMDEQQAKIEQLQSDIDQMRIAKIVDNLHEMEVIKERAELQAELESVNTANRELYSANESKKAKLDAVREYCASHVTAHNNSLKNALREYNEQDTDYVDAFVEPNDRPGFEVALVVLAILDGDT